MVSLLLRRRAGFTAFFFMIYLFQQTIISRPLFAQDAPQIVLGNKSSIEIADNFLFFEDSTGKLSLDDVLARSDQFKKADVGDLNQDHSHSNYWMRLKLLNQSPNEDWYIAAVYPLVDFDSYKIVDLAQRTVEKQTSLNLRIPANHLRIAPGDSQDFLLRVSSRHITNLQFNLITQAGLYERVSQEGMFFALICGCYLSMIIYNFLLYLTLRDVNYLYYLLFAVVNSHLNMLSIKFPHNIFTLAGIDWWPIVNIYSLAAPMITFLFVRSFLQTRVGYPRIDKLFLLYMAGLILLAIGLSLKPFSGLLLSLTDLYLIVGIIILISAGIISLREGFTPSRYYLAGLAIYFSGMLIYLLRCEGLIQANIFTLNAHIVTQASEMLLMSLALSGKIKMLEQDNIRSKVTTQIKGRLLRVISHDIANPLSVVKTTAYYLRSKEAVGGSMPMIMRAVGMIEDIMQFVIKSESLESGRSIPLEAVSVNDLFESLAFLFNDKSSEKGVKLHFIQDEPDLFVLGEKTSLRSEVMSNFLSNAIKFSFPAGDVTIRAQLQGDKRVLISIADKGMGMSAKTLESLFDPIENLSRTGTSGERGTGYGMPLAKAYLDMCKAQIKVESLSMDQDPEHCGTRVLAVFQRAFPNGD